MSSIIWSLTNGGTELTDAVDHGGLTNGAETLSQEFFIRHTYVNPITGVGLYLRQFTGTYTGAASALDDLAEIISWGDGATANDFGGFMVNFDADDAYAGAWPTLALPSSATAFVSRTGVGDSELNAITLPTDTGCSSAGEIPAGVAPNVRFSCKIVVPAAEDTIGIREFECALVYTYTS